MKTTITTCDQQTAASDRADYLDAARGVFVILIIVGHHLMGMPAAKTYICSFMLPPFMILSGFLYAYKKVWERPFRQTVVRNLQRLIYPYVTLSVINLVWNVLYYQVVFPDAVPEYSLKHMLLYTVTTYTDITHCGICLLFSGELCCFYAFAEQSTITLSAFSFPCS